VTQPALEKGQVVRTQDRAVIGCRREDCSLSSALVAPLIQRGEVVGALKLYHGAGRLIIERDEQVASGLARVFSVYLELAGLDAYAELVTRAQLEALRAQISPHFLFNALTTIAALTRVDADRAHGLILDFAEFFREALSERRELLRLRDELQNVERYLRFEQARFGDRLTVEYDIDPKTLDVLVPVLALQPLVENALTHGIAPKGGRGRVQISAQPLDGGCRIAIADDGVGIPPAIAERILERGNGSNLGVALNNVHHRLLGLFGTASGLQVESEVQRGTTVRFWLPPASAKKEGSR
jgi:two-component system LytT family sensor kinase